MANYSIPTWELAKSNKQQIRKVAVENLIKRARELRISCSYYNEKYPYEEPKDLTIRELRSDDLGLKNWKTPQLTPDIYVPWVDHKILNNNIVVIYAVSLLSKVPHVSTIRAGHIAYIFDLVEVEKLQVIIPLLRKLRDESTKESFHNIYDLSEMVMEAYFSEPWRIDGGNILKLDVLSHAKAVGDRILLRGFVGEPKGMTVA